ncbi:Uncharacterised protein [Ewingella americana]|uniref:Histidine phosphatase superfamily (Branch 1) n=1 Tax=Ewingella americana TaxID=41202 RepID=A0A377N6T1_9GAMM|nr:Uncharacterised protein [Ewingella americana]
MKAMNLGLLACGLLSVAMTSQMASAQETLIFVRHGEKPTSSSGQLTCKGLNRALALPGVLLPRYGNPDHIFAAGRRSRSLVTRCARFPPSCRLPCASTSQSIFSSTPMTLMA